MAARRIGAPLQARRDYGAVDCRAERDPHPSCNGAELKTRGERKLVAALQTAFAAQDPGRLLVVCHGSQADAMTQAKALAIDLIPYGSAKLGQFWGTCPRSQKINVAVWLLMVGTRAVFCGDV